jgi:hypothetical protein
MSDHPIPEEPLIIKSDRAHTVSIPEGTNMAVGKKGEVGEPSIRKVIADSDEHAVENIVMDGGVSKSPDQNSDNMAHDPNYKGFQSAAEIPDRFVDNPKEVAVPPPLRKSLDVTALETDLKTQDIETGVDAKESDVAKEAPLAQVAAPQYAPEPEMNFPARVINIKIENDKLRGRLDSLEQRNSK